MSNNFNINDVIEIDINNEICIDDLIYSIDKSKKFEIFEINEDDEIKTEKNILIKIKK